MEKRSETILWGREFVNNAYLYRNRKDEDWKESSYFWYLEPFAKPFYNPLNPIVLSIDNSLKHVMKKDVLMIRDGHIPLVYFFRENPYTTKFPKLFIQKDFWFLVPDEWRAHVNYYSIESNVEFNAKKLPKKILLAGLTNGMFVDQIEFEEDIKFLVETIGKENLKNIEFNVYLPQKRTDLWGGWTNENILKTLQFLFKNVGTHLNFPEWEEIESELNCKETLYYEFNRGHILKESYIKNLVLSRGAELLERKRSEDKMLFNNKGKIQLSLNHHLNLYTLNLDKAEPYLDPTSSEYFNYFRKTIESHSRIEEIHKDWDKWFGTFLKRYSKFKEKYSL